MTIQKMIEQSISKGSYFFTKDTMRFWGTTVHTTPNKYGLFITSDDNFDRTKKLYSVRFYEQERGQVETLSFQQHETLESADVLRRNLTAAVDICTPKNTAVTAMEKASILDDGHFIVTFSDGTQKELNTNNGIIETLEGEA